MFVFNFWEYKREKILTSCLQYILKIGGGCFSVLAKQFEGKQHTLSSSFWCESRFFIFTLYITMIQDVNLVPPNMDNLYFTADELSCLLQNYDNLSNEERRCFDFYMVNLKVKVKHGEGRGHWTVYYTCPQSFILVFSYSLA